MDFAYWGDGYYAGTLLSDGHFLLDFDDTVIPPEKLTTVQTNQNNTLEV